MDQTNATHECHRNIRLIDVEPRISRPQIRSTSKGIETDFKKLKPQKEKGTKIDLRSRKRGFGIKEILGSNVQKKKVKRKARERKQQTYLKRAAEKLRRNETEGERRFRRLWNGAFIESWGSRGRWV